MQTKIEKSKLLHILKENRSKHREIFEEAVEGYRKKAVEILNSHIETIKAGKLITVYWNLARPEDHTRDYDRVIAMVDRNVEDTITLSEQDFSSYVQDDWQWKRQFLVSNSVYSAGATMALQESEEDEA
jgi:hypothetical protein